MRKNKLYTVNKGNQPAFMFKGNIFWPGGDTENSMAIWDKYANKAGYNHTDDYMNSKNWLGLSKQSNPFSKANLANAFSKQGLSNALQGAGTGLLNAGAGMLGGLAGNAIAGGYSAGAAGDIVGTVASTGLGIAGTAIGGPIGGMVGSALGSTIGGLVNRAFGTKVDEAKKKAVEEGINNNMGFVSNAANLDDVQGPEAIMTDTNVAKGGWFSSSKARRINEDLKQRMITAKTFAERSVDNNINNLVDDQLNNALANYAAFGGPFDTINPSSAIGYSLYTDKYVEDMSRNNNKSTTNMLAGTPNAIYAFGGNVGTNSSDWSTGLTHIDTGGSHEENTYDGVQVGVDNLNTPNLVEEGEVIYNDYVFSNRLTIPKHKYAKGGKLKKGKELSYELQVLKPFEGLTFAKAAKKIEKKSGAADRPTDAIAQRGMEAELSVLRDVQEKEREKEKLREMQEAIDNMTPEEFAMLQQQMKASQELQAQLEAMAQQQLMIPQGMEYMLQPIEEQQPIAALGGLLNTPDKKFFYDGGWTDYLKELQKYDITPEQYIAYLNSVTTSENPVTLETIGDDNFGKNNVADEVLNKIDTIVKQYNRRAKKQGIKADDLKGAIKIQYNRELNQAIQRGLINADYDVSQDTELTFNNSSVSNAKNRQQAYNNAATYNDLIARGGKAVELDEQGRPIWESMAGLSKIDNSAEDFYTNLGDLNKEALNNRGIYDYISSNPSSIADKDNLKLYGWQLGEDGNYTVNKTLVSPNEASRTAGNSKGTYKPSDLGDLTYGADGYRDALSNIQNNLAYKDQTSYVTLAITDAKGDYSKLPTDIQNYLEYLDANTGNRESKLLVRDKDGNITGIANNSSQLYDKRRNDNIYGIYHYQFDRGNNTTANRYYYKDKDKDGKDINVYISRPEGTDFTISENPTVTTGTDGTQFNDYEVTGLNKNRTLTLLPTGEVVDVTNINDKNNWTTLDKPVLADNTDNLGYGINGTTNWVDYSSSPAAKTIKTDNDPFPKAPSWPYLAGLGIQAGALGYNILSPKDYSNADAMIKAAYNAGNYNPIAFRPIGNYLTYRPMDIWFEQNRMDANSRATDRAILNSGANQGSKSAALLANGYNNQIASGELYKKALEYNDALRKQVGEFNKDTDKFNSEGFLKADMANQDAATRARGYTLEGLKSGYAMRQAVDDAKAAAINAGISGLGTMLYNYAANKYNQDMLGWGIRNGAYAPLAAKGGQLKNRRKKGLSF